MRVTNVADRADGDFRTSSGTVSKPTAAHQVRYLAAGTKTNFSLQQVPADVGSGTINWRRVLPAAWDAGIRRFYVEEEPPFACPSLDAVKSSFEFLRALRA